MSATTSVRRILGLDLSVLSPEAAADLLERSIRERTPLRLAFVNANLANMASDDERIYSTLTRFLLFNDGVGINLASRLLHGRPFPANLNGTDFAPFFLDSCRTSLKVFLLGARPEVLARAVEVFHARWPRHQLVGSRDGYFAPSEEGQVLAAIKSAKPDLVLVGMGNGTQERWVDRLVPEFALSAWGVGALFDFLAGEVPRAPSWVRRLAFEWVYRLYLEPRRMWRRYILGNPQFLFRVLRERLQQRQR